MTGEQTPLGQLLEDPIFLRWTAKAPTLPDGLIVEKPWRIFAQIDGRWRMRDFKRYSKAIDFLMDNLGRFEDAALHSKIRAFKPPVVRRKGTERREYYLPGAPGQHPDHRWCGYCRRPTLMAHFSKHHALKHCVVWERRCTVCGHREEHLPRY